MQTVHLTFRIFCRITDRNLRVIPVMKYHCFRFDVIPIE